MLSNKEKKTIEHLKIVVKERNIIPLADEVSLVLNLIEKQQKEIESLKEDNKKKSIVIIEYQDLYEKLEDKIKAKIEEYEQDVKDFEEYWSKDPRKFKKEKSVDYYKLEALKELLEKE